MKNYFFLVLIFLFLLSPFSVEALLKTGLKTMYSFDSDVGQNVTDVNGFLNATSGTSISIVKGKVGWARGFVSSSTYTITVPDNASMRCQKQCSFMYWINATAVMSTGKGVWSKNPQGWWLTTEVGGDGYLSGMVYDGGSSCTASDNTSMTTYVNQWYHFIVTFDDDANLIKIYKNGVKQNNVACAVSPLNTAGVSYIGAHGGAGSGVWNGLLDEVAYWNRTLSDAEVLELYNSGNGLNFSLWDAPAVPDLVINSVNLTNRSFSVHNLANITTETLFYVLANITDNSQCRFSLTNLTDFFSNFPSNNFSLTGANSLEFSFNDAVENTTNQRVVVRLCREGGVSNNVNFYVNSNVTGLKWVTNASYIPACTNSFHQENFVFTDNQSSQQNLSIQCPACTGINTIRVLSFGEYNSSVKWYRLHNLSSHNLTQNGVSKLYNYSGHFHTFFNPSPNVSINVTCNNTYSSVVSFVVREVNPVASFLSIDYGVEVPFSSNETKTNSSSLVTIVGECSGTTLVSKMLNVSYSNGTLISSVNSEVINLTSGQLNKDGLYIANLYCGGVSNHSRIVRTFWVNDTLNPVITWLFPLVDNSSVAIKNFPSGIQVSYADLNLYGVNITCSHNLMGGVFSFFILNLSGGVFLIDNITSNLSINGNVTCITEVCDSHTDSVFVPGELVVDVFKENFSMDGRLIFDQDSQYQVTSLDFIQKADRVSPVLTYDFLEDKFDSEVKVGFKVPVFGGWSLINSKFGHFATWDYRLWQDFKSDNFRVDSVSREGDFWVVDGVVLNPKDSVVFDSVGGLNCVSSTVRFQVLPEVVPVVPVSLSNISTANVLFLAIFGLFWIVLLVTASLGKSLILGVISSFFGFAFGFMIMPLSGMAGTSTLLVVAFVTFGFMFKGKL